MSKRYAYYRDPSGGPYKGVDGKYAPANLLHQVGLSSKIQDGRGVWQWQGFRVGELLASIESSIAILDNDDVELNETDTNLLVGSALEQIARENPGEPIVYTRLLEQVNKRAAEFFRKPQIDFVLVTSLSTKRLPGRIKIGTNTISALKARGTRYPLPKVLESPIHNQPFAAHINSTEYMLVRVDTKARSIHQGVENGLNALALVRALWSLTITRGSWSMHLGSPKRRPIGVIHTGPLHTLHRKDGTAANENYYWFTPGYVGDQELFKHSDQWPAIEKDRRWAMRKMSNLPYRNELEELLLRYISALDEPNPHLAFLQLWGILEKITNTVGGQYDETIKKATWIYVDEERGFRRDFLAALRQRRNRYVHGGFSGAENRGVTHELKAFVDPHFAMLIHNAFGVGSLREYGDFLSQPTSLDSLKRIKRWSSKAVAILRKELKQVDK